MSEIFGGRMDRWYITRTKSPDGKWHVCPPLTEEPDWHQRGGQFATGAEALAAFAAGGKRGLYEDLTIRDRTRSKAQSRLIGGMP